jgi:hypothetical protein
MKKSHFTEAQIIYVIKERARYTDQRCLPTLGLVRIFFTWKKKFMDMGLPSCVVCGDSKRGIAS